MAALLQIIVTGTQLMLVADKVPELKYETSCRAAVTAAAMPGRNADACMRDEKTAKDKLQQEWGQFSAEQKSHCLRLMNAGGMPSYVELLTCAEMGKAAANLPAGGNPKSKIER